MRPPSSFPLSFPSPLSFLSFPSLICVFNLARVSIWQRGSRCTPNEARKEDKKRTLFLSRPFLLYFSSYCLLFFSFWMYSQTDDAKAVIARDGGRTKEETYPFAKHFQLVLRQVLALAQLLNPLVEITCRDLCGHDGAACTAQVLRGYWKLVVFCRPLSFLHFKMNFTHFLLSFSLVFALLSLPLPFAPPWMPLLFPLCPKTYYNP